MDMGLKLSLARLILVQLVPIVGVVFFDWDLFEIMMIYLVETLCIYIVFNFDHYFLQPKTRYPAPFAILQLGLSLLPFGGILLANALVVFYVLYETDDVNVHVSDLFARRLETLNLAVPFITLFILELVSYFVKKKLDKNHVNNGQWRVYRRILYTTLFIAIGSIILSFFPHNLFIMVPFFIGLKMMMEFSTEDKRIWNNLRHRLMERKKKSTQ